MSRMRMGIVGTGRMAATMVRAASLVPEIEVVSVASASGSGERAQQFGEAFSIRDAHADVAIMLKQAKPDFVYIATNTAGHVAASLQALHCRVPVVCEKPMATSLDQARRLFEAARSHDTLFVEALWTLLLPSHRRARSAVESQAIGTPTHLVASFGYPSSEVADRAAFRREDGGVLLDRAVYPLALAISLLGPVTGMDSRVRVDDKGLDVDASLQLEHASGARSQLAASLSSLLANEAVLSGTGGSLRIEAPLLGSESLRWTRAVVSGSPASSLHGRDLRQRLRNIPWLRWLQRGLAGGRREFCTYGADQYLPLLQHVARLVREGRRESDIVPPALSLEVARLVEAARLVRP